MKTQDPKFDIVGSRLCNAKTGKPIPNEEPLFMLRGKDKHAVQALAYYKALCSNPEHQAAVDVRLREFREFSEAFGERMSEPDT